MDKSIGRTAMLVAGRIFSNLLMCDFENDESKWQSAVMIIEQRSKLMWSIAFRTTNNISSPYYSGCSYKLTAHTIALYSTRYSVAISTWCINCPRIVWASSQKSFCSTTSHAGDSKYSIPRTKTTISDGCEEIKIFYIFTLIRRPD